MRDILVLGYSLARQLIKNLNFAKIKQNMLRKPSLKEINDLRLETLTKMTDLATAGFGLVAALAWNEAIQSLVNAFLPKSSSGGIIAQLIYAVIITALVVIITVKLGKMSGRAKEQAEESRPDKAETAQG